MVIPKVLVLINLVFQVFASQEQSLRLTLFNEQNNVYENIGSYQSFEDVQEYYQIRKLQQEDIQPIRITFDYSGLENTYKGQTLSHAQINYIKKLFEVTSSFLATLIKVSPKKEPISLNPKCYYFVSSEYQRQQVINNSDLHIYVSFENKNVNDHLAYAISCFEDGKPRTGQITVNTHYLDFKKELNKFQQELSTIIHEIMHILGFSKYWYKHWINQETNQPHKAVSKREVRYEENISYLYYIHSKNILQVAKNHFGCSKIRGFYLENQGTTGSQGSHWETDLLGNESMTANSKVDDHFSQFTTALLRDTGFYEEINSNLLQSLKWGENMGCDIFFNTCNSDQNNNFFFKETYQRGCTFDYQGVGYVYQGQFSQCSKILSGNSCSQNEYHQLDLNHRYETGDGSKCFISNASIRGLANQLVSGRCLISKCQQDGSIYIKIYEEESVLCKYPGQIIDLMKETKNSSGILKCPHDFELICNYKTINKCPQDCNNNGYCNNQMCICQKNYSGEDCSHFCPKSDFPIWNGSKCIDICPLGYFRNLNNICSKQCPSKQYGDENTRICTVCHYKCSSCFGPKENQCNSCNKGYFIKGTTCSEGQCDKACETCFGPNHNQCTTCQEGYYLDFFKKTCNMCKSPCKTCSSERECTSCVTGYQFEKTWLQCFSQNHCDDNCAECNKQKQSCIFCKEGYFQNEYGRCEMCGEGCSNCTKDIQCSQCNIGYYLKYSTFGYKFCQKCDSNCQTCNEISSCLSCIDSYNYDSKSKKCTQQDQSSGIINNITRKTNGCEQNCQSCDELNHSKNCKQCNEGYYLKNGYCYECQPTCKTCFSYKSGCESCFENYKLEQRQCKMIVSQSRCDSSCLQCDTSNSRKCSKCQSNQWLNQNLNENFGSCVNCNTNCKTCSSEFHCTSCNYGYELINNECLQKKSTLIENCDPYCKKCQYQNNKPTCSQCIEGYFLKFKPNFIKICEKCDLNCKSCHSFDSCITCSEGYLFNKYKKCAKCPSGTEFKNGLCIEQTHYLLNKS